MHHFVYALYSPDHEKIYIGRSSNIKARLMSHFYTGSKGFTTRYRPWRLAYLEKCESREATIVREKQLKSAKGRAFIWNVVRKKFG